MAGESTEAALAVRIIEQYRGDQFFYDYELQSQELKILKLFQSKFFDTDRQEFVHRLYQEIEVRWLDSEQDKALFQADLRAFGGSLFDQLIPEKLQRLLWRHRKDFDSIMVISTEPFIPWDLVHLKDPDKTQLPSETLFLAQLGLVRWLRGSWPPNKIRKNRTCYVIPNYPNAKYELPQTQEEKKFLEQKLHGRAVEPQPLAVQALLREPGSFDLLHFACHGGAEDGNIMHAKLMMEGRAENNCYIPAYLSATMVRQFASLQGPDGARPMIVLNACQAGRIGFKLTGLGGFAQAFHTASAGAFVGPLWSVGDYPARIFTESLYTELLSGKNLAQATKTARSAAQQAGDATWLAYAVYGHPHMMFQA